MKQTDFKIFECPKCGKRYGNFYMPPLSKDEGLKELELKEYADDFHAYLGEDGKFRIPCDCGQDAVELSYEKWNAGELCEILGNILEDNNRHNMVGTPCLFRHCMEQAGIADDKIQEALKHLLDYYSETESMQL